MRKKTFSLNVPLIYITICGTDIYHNLKAVLNDKNVYISSAHVNGAKV